MLICGKMLGAHKINKGKYQMKTDSVLGEGVHNYLVKQGVETPLKDNSIIKSTPEFVEKQIAEIAYYFRRIMNVLNLDDQDDSLRGTPDRVGKMFVKEIFSGLNYNNFPKCTTVENKMGYDEMVIEKNITCISACEHHFVTIDQQCHIAYIPNKKVLGLSKLNRVAKFFAQRPQIQERFTEQVFYALCFILETENVAIVTEGRHYCVAQRGVEDQTSTTITSKLGGCFKSDPACRAEFMAQVRGK